jgi:predicted nucleic acid-binding protein
VIVVDASVIVEVLLGTPASGRIVDRILAPRASVHAPHLLDLEVANALRRYSVFGTLPPDWGRDALEDLRGLPITRYPHDLFLGRIWELRNNIAAYDAAYVALSEALDAPLLTRDARLADSSGHQARIECL